MFNFGKSITGGNRMLNSLFVVILLEGFVVLAFELLAIRQLLPFVGSGTDVVAIVIGAVLMPLSLGYYSGGNFKIKRKNKRPAFTVRRKLIWNILVASAIFLIGLSYPTMILFFELLNHLNVEDELIRTFIYSSTFLVYPVYLMGQTIPLVTNFFKFEHLPDITGRILFCSTIGSFCGSIISTIVLMGTIGVHNTVIVIFFLILMIVFILAKRVYGHSLFFAIAIFALAVILNNDMVMKKFNVVSNNVYSLTRIIKDDRGDTIMNVNHSGSSKMALHYENMFDYVKFIEGEFITPTLENGFIAPLDILILGAGGFTMGYNDMKNNYTYVDIDKSLKELSEMYMLKGGLATNKQFVAKGARAFLNQTDKKFDLIIVDLYSNKFTIPSHLITVEFYAAVKAHLQLGGIVTMNIIASPHFKNNFSRKIDNTIRVVFKAVNRHLIHGYSPWTTKDKTTVNTIYTYVNTPSLDDDTGVYTDNLNTYFLDK